MVDVGFLRHYQAISYVLWPDWLYFLAKPQQNFMTNKEYGYSKWTTEIYQD